MKNIDLSPHHARVAVFREFRGSFSRGLHAPDFQSKLWRVLRQKEPISSFDVSRTGQQSANSFL